MLTICPQPPTFSVSDNSRQPVQYRTMGDAVSSFTKSILAKVEDPMVQSNGLTLDPSTAAIRLHCTIPTWSSATATCLDLYDLHELKYRALDLIHDLLQSLRSSGMTVSYSLVPSDSSLCIVYQRQSNLDVLEQAKQCSLELERGKVTFFTIGGAPCLVLA